MGRTTLRLVAAALAIGTTISVASADGREDALWLARFTHVSERMFALAIKKRDILALETNAVLFDVAIEQAGLSGESTFEPCWAASIALQGLIAHLLSFDGELRQVFSDRMLSAYQERMPKCEALVGESAERLLTIYDLITFPVPGVHELTQVTR